MTKTLSGLMNYVITLKTKQGKERKTVVIDHKNHGVNGVYTKKKVMPILLKELGYEGAEFELTGFRYYLGTYIYAVTINPNTDEVRTGHIVMSWLSGTVKELEN